MAAREDTPAERECKGCSTPITRLRFCSGECRRDWYRRTSRERDEARRRRLGVKPASAEIERRRAVATKRRCWECGNLFFPGRKLPSESGGIVKRYCSRRCVDARRRRPGNLRRGAEVIAKRAAEFTAMNAAACKAVSAFACRVAIILRPCAICGGNRSGRRGGYGDTCVPCAPEAKRRAREAYKRTDRWRAMRRAAKSRRRAIERGAAAERFDPFEIFERDRWRCHICGEKTPQRLRGTYEDRAPELDHIIPLAAGGTHTRNNVACACRRCNLLKSDRPLGQLLLNLAA